MEIFGIDSACITEKLKLITCCRLVSAHCPACDVMLYLCDNLCVNRAIPKIMSCDESCQLAVKDPLNGNRLTYMQSLSEIESELASYGDVMKKVRDVISLGRTSLIYV